MCKKYLLQLIKASIKYYCSDIKLTKRIRVLDIIDLIAKWCSGRSSEKIAFRKACFRKLFQESWIAISSSENDQGSVEQLEGKELQSLIKYLKCVPNPAKVKEADYVSAENAACTTKASTSVSVIIQLYYDVRNRSENEDDYNS